MYQLFVSYWYADCWICFIWCKDNKKKIKMSSRRRELVYIFFKQLKIFIMFYDSFKVDNSRFGAVLSEEMKNHHITGSHLVACADMRKENVYAI